MHPPSRAVYCRVTVLAPRRRVDVALPADVPVAELVPMLLELLGEPGPRPGAGPRAAAPWRLTGAAGGPLAGSATLEELGVLDGEFLRIAPEQAPPPPPVFDDPVDAVAATVEPAAGTPAPTALRAVLVTVGGAAVLLALAPPGTGAVGVALRCAIALLAALTALGVTARLDTDGADLAVARTTALAAVALSAAAGWVAVPDPRWGVRVLLAATAAALAAGAGQYLLGRVQPLLVGIVVATAAAAGGALVHLQFGVDARAVAAALGAIALVAGPLLPRAALLLAGVPRPVVPADARELVGADADGPPVPTELADAAQLARGHLAGLTGGAAVVAAAAAPAAAALPGVTGPLLATVLVAVLLLRARGFADAAPARTLLHAALAGLAAVSAVAAGGAGPAAGIGAALVLLTAAAFVTLVVVRHGPGPSPVARRAIDVVENVLLASAVPLALGAAGVYALVRAL